MSGLIVKLSGSVFIIASGFLFSKSLSERLKADIRFADGLISGFVSLEEYICGMLIPVDEAFRLASACAGEASEVFASVAGGNGPLRDRFSKALSAYADIYYDVLSGLVGGISASDENERRAAFSIIRTRLAGIRESSEREYIRLGRLYNSVGILGGIMIVILLF